MININAHIHTPYSFSSFSGMNEAFEMAVKENIKVLGINDFYVTDGYEDFFKLATENKIYPLFNFEAIALSKDMQENGTRINDPANPGRVYICGKGLNYPATLSDNRSELLENLKAESQRQIVEIIYKLDSWLCELGINFIFAYETIRSRFARKLVRERHIAQALRTMIFEQYHDDNARKEILKKIYDGIPTSVDINNHAALENELRNNLLKAGKKAFVPEDEKAFLTVWQLCDIIIDSGGIPCYPVLLDDAAGNFTEFEENWENLFKYLIDWNIFCIELIPHRNKLEILEPFVKFFHEKGIIITFGTEHNTPGIMPLTPCCSGAVPLTNYLKKINYEGACIIAAHQYLHQQGKPGFIDDNGNQCNHPGNLKPMGDLIIKEWIN